MKPTDASPKWESQPNTSCIWKGSGEEILNYSRGSGGDEMRGVQAKGAGSRRVKLGIGGNEAKFGLRGGSDQGWSQEAEAKMND